MQHKEEPRFPLRLLYVLGKSHAAAGTQITMKECRRKNQEQEGIGKSGKKRKNSAQSTASLFLIRVHLCSSAVSDRAKVWRMTSATSSGFHSLPGHIFATVPSGASKIVFILCDIWLSSSEYSRPKLPTSF